TDLFAAVGFGDVTAGNVAQRLREESKTDNVVAIPLPRPSTARRVARNASGIRIAGVDDVLVRLSKCCSPVPGDPIMGFVTIGKGVSVHRADCPNTAYMNAAPSASSKPNGWTSRRSRTRSTSRSRPPTAAACCKTSSASRPA
ncbi:MAG TPA: hypothetical protein VN224_14560, partial [Xanthomonadales bacterium]|nr:hypothetical protein [Xanthomonadales bacterium]